VEVGRRLEALLVLETSTRPSTFLSWIANYFLDDIDIGLRYTLTSAPALLAVLSDTVERRHTRLPPSHSRHC
jgi:hypothetical protein